MRKAMLRKERRCPVYDFGIYSGFGRSGHGVLVALR
jgi:hypothetical protein